MDDRSSIIEQVRAMHARSIFQIECTCAFEKEGGRGFQPLLGDASSFASRIATGVRVQMLGSHSRARRNSAMPAERETPTMWR